MFGFGGTTGFGQPAQQPAPAFGAQPASPFGAAFGQPAQPAASPFGATTGSAPLFGAQTPTPAFGQAAPSAAPSFGAAAATTGFGATNFGAAKPAGFGGFGTSTTTAANPFGTTTQTPGAFGSTAQSAPAFGAGLGTAPSFGATLTPTPAFGAASTPAFGAPQSAPAFGGFGAASAPAFGAPAAAPANPFGATASGFGGTAGPAFGSAPAATGFGAPQTAAAPFGSTTGNLFGAPSTAPTAFGAAPAQQATGFGGFGAAPSSAPTNGTRNVPYSKTKDPDVAAGQPATFLMSISAMPNFQPPNAAKSHEELRWEDFQDGVKNQSAGPAPAAANAFGAPAAGGFGGFGAPATAAATGFGTAPASPFGASAPAFGTTTAPAFGTNAASQPSLFGASTAAPGAASNPFAAPAMSAPAFGGFGGAPAAASQPSLFGAASTAATGFGTAAPFGSTPFGGASSAAAFSFNSSPSTFGAASAPATSLFGTAPASSPFGGTSTLGAVGTPFNAASSASAFGTNTFGAFGATAAKPASPFGTTTTTTPFGTTAPAATGGLFGGSTFNFNTQPASSPSLFGNNAGGSTLSFSNNLFSAPASATAAGGMFGAPAAAAAAPVQPPSVAQPAYGNFGSLPTVPDVKVGITARGGRNSSISSGASKASPLLSLRPTPVRYGASVRARSEQPPPLGGFGAASAAMAPTLPPGSSLGGGVGASDLLMPQAPSGSGSAAAAAVAAAAAGVSGLLPPRQNPHRLFIAAPPPSTEAAGGSSFLSPARPASAQRAATPDGLGDDGAHADGPAAETPAPRHTGLNGFTTGGYPSGGAAAAAATAQPAGGSAAGRAAAPAGAGMAASPGFQDAPASEPHLPRLGRLVSDGYAFSPNVDELRLLHSQNPDNLASVSNFTVSRAGVGQVRWVVPVDVRGVSLYDIVSISYGEVLCYPDISTKPPQGSGLNKPAELTLYGVYKKDKDTGMPIKEGSRGQAYEKALRVMCGRMGAKFISYKLDGGVWKFEVEHFSRYGLMDLEDDDEAAGAGAAAGAAAGRAAVEEGVGEAPGAAAGAGIASQQLCGGRRLGLGVQNADGGDSNAPHRLAGRGLAGVGLRGFAFGALGAPAASAAGRGAAAVVPEDSGMEPSVGVRQQQYSGGMLLEAGASETTGMAGAADQDMSEARAQLRFGDDAAVEAEVSGGVMGPAAASTATGSLALMAPTQGGAPEVNEPPGVPLQHTLGASLAHDPMRARALQEAFFGGGGAGGGGGGGNRSLGGGGGATASHVYPPPGQTLQTHRQQMQRGVAAGGGAERGGKAGPGAGGTTVWRRPAAALSVGPPAAVLSRGAMLTFGADGEVAAGGMSSISGTGPGGFGASPISLALARPLALRPTGITTDAATAVLPLRDVRTARCLTDAGLAMGRSFRVGWGPGGKLVVPGAAEAASAMEISVIRVRVEGEGAAYGEASYSSGAGGGGSEEAEGLETLRERLRAALGVHLAASRAVEQQQEDPMMTGSGDGATGGNDGAAAPASSAALPLPHWRLSVDARELAVLADRYIRVAEQQLQTLLGGGAGDAGGGGGVDVDHPDALRLRHEIDTWRLVEVLFARIEGEVPEEEGEEGSVGQRVASTADGTEGGSAGGASDGAAGGGSGGGADEDAVMDGGAPSTPAPQSMALALVPAAGAGTRDYDMSGGGESPRTPAPDAQPGAERQHVQQQPSQQQTTLLPALRRRAALGLWLQRQARRRVEADLSTASSPASVVLHLLAAHQLAAAAGAAVAAGDARLAVLIARASSRTSARSQLASQLAIWQRAGFTAAMAPERLAAYHLLAGQVLETQRLLSLDWRRLLGLHLWYNTSSTIAPITAAVHQYVMDRQMEPAIVPHPAPYHVEGLQPSATGAAGGATSGCTDVQWELLQLWATTPAAVTADCTAAGQLATAPGVAAAVARARDAWLGGGGCSRLLRVAGYSSNPLDHSLAWHLMTTLQAIRVLPTPGAAAHTTAGDTDDVSETAVAVTARSLASYDVSSASYGNELVSTTLEFISQLLVAGGLCEWALYVALTLPDLAPTGAGGSTAGGVEAGGAGGDGSGDESAVRRRVVRELLAATVTEWMGDSTKETFLTSTLRIPPPLLAEARATWAHYTRDDAGRCAALLAARDAAAAHDVFTAIVGPALFMAAAWTELARLVAALEPAASALPAWTTGGGLYGTFIALFGRQLTAMTGTGATWSASGGVPEGVTLSTLMELAQQVQSAQLALNAGGDARVGVVQGVGSSVGGSVADDAAAASSKLLRRLVLGRMAARVHSALLAVGAPAAVGCGGRGWEGRGVALCTGMALQGCLSSELQLGGLAVAVAEAGARVACSM